MDTEHDTYSEYETSSVISDSVLDRVEDNIIDVFLMMKNYTEEACPNLLGKLTNAGRVMNFVKEELKTKK